MRIQVFLLWVLMYATLPAGLQAQSNPYPERENLNAFASDGYIDSLPSFVYFKEGNSPQETNRLKQDQMAFLQANGLATPMNYLDWKTQHEPEQVFAQYKANCTALKGSGYYKTYVQQGGYLLLNKLNFLQKGSDQELAFIAEMLIANEYRGMHLLELALTRLQAAGFNDVVADARKRISAYYKPFGAGELSSMEQLASTAKTPDMQRIYQQSINNMKENDPAYQRIVGGR